jgi:hypothetical protein
MRSKRRRHSDLKYSGWAAAATNPAPQPAVPYICCCGSLVTGLCFPVEAVIGAIPQKL